MLAKISFDKTPKPIIKRFANGKECSDIGAFPRNTTLKFSVCLPRILGASAVVLRINQDGREDIDIPLEFISTELGVDNYSTELELAEMCDSDGLFFYEFLFIRGVDTLFTSSVNNVDFELSERSDRRFRILVYENDFATPDWIKGKTIYQIFVDRFYKGSKEVELREDAVLNSDWENGIPQYPEENGARFTNNVFFGGTLWGVAEKLDYIKKIGADVIYLNPIFKAYSNHKYDTGDYNRIDEMFGGEEAFAELIKKADKLGIKVILDGVFNHSGDDSVYFDKYGKYGGKGAYSDPDSIYRNWYNFKKYPNEYESWWGIDIHPRLNHNDSECRDFFVGENGITQKYVKAGIGGWRLDVADELSDEFLDMLRKNVKRADPEALIIGEVWENAADKISYGVRRRYFRGRQLDSVMNYPFRTAVLDFLRYRDARVLSDTLKDIYSSYPTCVCHCLMNILGTHDTERILTVLGGMCDESQLRDGLSNEILAHKRLPKHVRKEAKKLLYMAAVIQFTVYGVPSVFYGDEAGLEGYHDPFCRRTYPWGKEDKEVLSLYKKLGKIRRENEELVNGDFSLLESEGGFIAYRRGSAKENLIVAVNRGEEDRIFNIRGKYVDLLSGAEFCGIVKNDSALILKKLKKERKNGNIKKADKKQRSRQ